MGRLHNTENNKEKTFKGRLFESAPVKKPTLGDKVKAVGKEVVKGIVSPVVTTVARPFQAAAALGGVSDEKINEFSKKISGGYIAPTPQNTSDVVKDVGRAGQTVLLGVGGNTLKGVTGLKNIAPVVAKEGAIGAGFGAGVALEQGGSETTAKDVLKSSAIGAVTGAVAPLAIKGVGRLFKGKTAPVVEEAVEKTIIPKAETPAPKVNIPEGPTLLPERTQTPSKQGDNFTFTDTVDPTKVATTKARTDYETKLKAYNQNPTPNKLKGVMKAKDTLAKVESTPASIPTNSTVKPVGIPTQSSGPKALNNNFEKQTNAGQKAVINAQDQAHIEDVVFKGAKPKDGVPIEAYLAELEKRADELARSGDTSLSDKVAKSNIFRQAGQGLQAAKRDKGFTSLLRDIRTQLEDTLPKTTKTKKNAEINKISSELSEALESFKNNLPSKADLIDKLEKLRCP